MAILRDLGTPCLIHQPAYNLLRRDPELGVLDALEAEGVGCIAFSPLSQGMLSDKYLQGIPAASRAAHPHGTLNASRVTPDVLAVLQRLHAIAQTRQQSLAQMALAWVLRQPVICSARIGASRVEQLQENVQALRQLEFSVQELAAVDAALET